MMMDRARDTEGADPASGIKRAGGSAFSQEEVRLLADDRFFKVRSRVLARLNSAFERLRDRLMLQLGEGNYLTPVGADLSHGHVGRGEFLDDLPYVYLDYPRHFEGESYFTFRTLFWWGHEISFSLLLGGEYLAEYRQRLLRNVGILAALQVHVAATETPWDWRRGPGHTIPLAPGEEGTLLRLFRSQDFLKCSRFLSFEETEFRENRLDEAAVLTFRALKPLILA
jgi:hypothetical protein